MKRRSISYTGLGIIFGGAAGVVMFSLTGQIWWHGLVGVGLIVGAVIDGTKHAR